MTDLVLLVWTFAADPSSARRAHQTDVASVSTDGSPRCEQHHLDRPTYQPTSVSVAGLRASLHRSRFTVGAIRVVGPDPQSDHLLTINPSTRRHTRSSAATYAIVSRALRDPEPTAHPSERAHGDGPSVARVRTPARAPAAELEAARRQGVEKVGRLVSADNLAGHPVDVRARDEHHLRLRGLASEESMSPGMDGTGRRRRQGSVGGSTYAQSGQS